VIYKGSPITFFYFEQGPLKTFWCRCIFVILLYTLVKFVDDAQYFSNFFYGSFRLFRLFKIVSFPLKIRPPPPPPDHPYTMSTYAMKATKQSRQTDLKILIRFGTPCTCDI
jgi:hypothetical protein